jgi:hypothetical protein
MREGLPNFPTASETVPAVEKEVSCQIGKFHKFTTNRVENVLKFVDQGDQFRDRSADSFKKLTDDHS